MPQSDRTAPRGSKRNSRNLLFVIGAVIGVAVLTLAVARVGAAKATGNSVVPAPSANLGTNPTANWPDIKLMSATQVLNRAADLSVSAADQPIRPGQFRYVNKHAWVMNTMQFGDKIGYSYLWEQQDQRWIPADEHNVWQETRKVLNTGKFLGGSVPQAQATQLPPTDVDQGQWQGRCGDFFPEAKPPKKCDDSTDWDSSAFYAALPRDPSALYAKLQSLTKGNSAAPSAMFNVGIQVLEAGMMPAELRAQWYRALAKIPGMAVLAAETNLDGRTGVALGLDDGHQIRQLIIDPVTGQFIGERQIAGPQPEQSWIKPNTEIGSSAFTTAVVDQLGAAPAK